MCGSVFEQRKKEEARKYKIAVGLHSEGCVVLTRVAARLHSLSWDETHA